MISSRLLFDKSRCRSRLRHLIRRIARDRRRKKSREIVRRLVRTPEFRHSERILVYVSLPDEVSTRDLIRKTLALGKRVFVPKIAPRRRTIGIFEIKRPRRDLKPGSFGILEPAASPSKRGRAGDLDLVIAPALGFDRRGWRLGRGGGYFDRFLKRAKRAKKIGIAFREQILPSIPHARHDVRMDRVIFA